MQEIVRLLEETRSEYRMTILTLECSKKFNKETYRALENICMESGLCGYFRARNEYKASDIVAEFTMKRKGRIWWSHTANHVLNRFYGTDKFKERTLKALQDRVDLINNLIAEINE